MLHFNVIYKSHRIFVTVSIIFFPDALSSFCLSYFCLVHDFFRVNSIFCPPSWYNHLFVCQIFFLGYKHLCILSVNWLEHHALYFLTDPHNLNVIPHKKHLTSSVLQLYSVHPFTLRLFRTPYHHDIYYH